MPRTANWPAAMAPGGMRAQHCLMMDCTATLLAAGGATADPAFALGGDDRGPVLRDAVHTCRRPMRRRMNHRSQRALRGGRWTSPRVAGRAHLFDISADEPERAHRTDREPERPAAMRRAREDWNAAMSPIPDDATVSLGDGAQHLAQW